MTAGWGPDRSPVVLADDGYANPITRWAMRCIDHITDDREYFWPTAIALALMVGFVFYVLVHVVLFAVMGGTTK